MPTMYKYRITFTNQSFNVDTMSVSNAGTMSVSNAGNINFDTLHAISILCFFVVLIQNIVFYFY